MSDSAVSNIFTENMEYLNVSGSLLNSAGKIDSAALKALCLRAGADDAGVIPLGREKIREHHDDIVKALPGAKSLLSLVIRINRECVRSPFRTISDFECYQTGDQLSRASRRVVAALERQGIRAIYTPWGFPYESDRFPGKLWVVGHKQVAEEAGMGMTGRHRMVLHPRFGAFVYLMTIIMDREADGYGHPLKENPCDECNLCAISCPTGAISKDGYFDFVSCATHNYREKVGGFSDWVEQVIASKSRFDYRKRIDDKETFSMWQSLSFRAGNKCDYCMAVCPAGEEPHSLYEQDSKAFVDRIVKPLQEKNEKVFAVPGSDAETFVLKHFPHKRLRRVSNGLRPPDVKSFLFAMPIIFQRHQSEGLNAVYNFTFTGSENIKITAAIRGKTLSVREGHAEKADVHVTSDSETWCRFLGKEKNIIWAIITRKVKVKGPMNLFIAFGKCFPS